MLRTATSRLLPRSLPLRTFSSTPASFIRIRSSAPSPAEKPPHVPEDIKNPEVVETQVNDLGGQEVRGAPDLGTGEAAAAAKGKEAEAPLEPPSTSTTLNSQPSATPDAAAEEIPDTPDFSKLPSLDIDPDLPAPAAIEQPKSEQNEGGEKKKTGAGKKEYVSSHEKSRRMWIRLGYGGLAVGAIGAILTMESKPVEGAEKSEGIVTKVTNNVSELMDYFNKPAFKQLLPDPLPPPHQRPYTLCIDLEGLLVHSSWDRQHGWRTAKRPGADYFLAYLSQFYEIVLFTSQPFYTGGPIAEKIDPYQAYIPYRLFRESTRYLNGKVVKDISYLNRDPSKVVILDTNAEHVGAQPENGIVVNPWDGRAGDKGLVDLIPFLESIGIFAPKDVRPILTAYAGKDIPTEYAKKEAEAKAKAVEEWERAHPSAATGAGSGFLSSMFGSVSAPGQTRPNQPMTYLEQKRAQAQRIYQEEQKYWAEHADEFKKLIEEDKQKQLAEMKGSLLGFLGGPGAKTPEGPKEKL
ncbi:hypothetical protein L202_07264 [Cryptococcus amylolentus CBS 6039]|uniref:Mitochondrial import inner membrane translocase subunit TIM50 n=1 Tax=Cryptococcus amylolentus CBS 6039 TaxID=1295533 RepID=A0A1E3HBL9_9TREE|nr:hypothetical protein L202_07264 [Cryptococcus amylolentus CBS 6039]ODN73723.1 hypothetical protein L202_07264 [Cryptococcus amylolentus CBS 6039]